jgi:hypothetical protein
MLNFSSEPRTDPENDPDLDEEESPSEPEPAF